MSSTAIAERNARGSLEDLRDRIAAAYRVQFPPQQPDGSYRYSYIVATFPDRVIAAVDSPEGELYIEYDLALDGDAFTFSNPREMDFEYVPAEAVAEAARLRVERATRDRQQFREVRAVEAAEPAGDTVTITVIQSGFNVSRSRYYTEAALREGVGVFRGLKMYVDHQTAAQERERPEGSIRDWAAVITETVYDPATKRIRATAKLIDPDFKAKVSALAEAGLLDTLGVSIRAVGSGEVATIEGVSTFRVDEFADAISVDFVTEPGAGGRVEFLEAAEAPGIEALTLPSLRSRRPDLVQALLTESNKHKEDHMEVTQEQLAAEKARADEAERRFREAEEARAAAEAAKAAAESAVEEMRAEAEKREAQEAIGKLIAESGLPDPSKTHLRESLAESRDVEAARAAIESHRNLVSALTGKGTVTGNGGGESHQSSARPMAESLKRLGYTDEQIAIAERGR